jgi:hypothetical protein
VVLCACSGPAAPDVEVCRDAIHRLCLPEPCALVPPLFPAGKSCESELLAASGCARDDFAFKSPDRTRFLSCRVALLRAGGDRETHPSCEDVAESFERCPDVVRFYQGKP